MELYINSTGSINGDGSIEESFPTNTLFAVEPDYKEYIPPMQLRRMSKAVRMGIGASRLAMEGADITSPDALSVGTAMGCLSDTEVFLKKMIAQEEQMLTPTSFIQSTHNTVAGQIALHTKCNGHNMTYVHRGHSFEHAMVNAQLYLNDNPEDKVLVGGLDELTDGSIAALQKGDIYTKEQVGFDSQMADNTTGAIAGEGATFFVVTNKPLLTNALCVKDVYCFNTKEEEEAIRKVEAFANCHGKDIDLIVLGNSGDDKHEQFYTHIKDDVFEGVCAARFKHICGEYAVSSAVALNIIATKVYPSGFFVGEQPKAIKKVIIINHFMHYYNCWYVELPV